MIEENFHPMRTDLHQHATPNNQKADAGGKAHNARLSETRKRRLKGTKEKIHP